MSITSVFIFNESGMLLFHHDLSDKRTDPKLVSAFLSAIDQWAKMYSSTGVSLFITGSMKFTFERSIYARDLIFCIAGTHDHNDAELHEKVQVVRENFVHVFWEDLKRLQAGISKEKLVHFKKMVVQVLKKE